MRDTDMNTAAVIKLVLVLLGVVLLFAVMSRLM